MGEKTDIAWCHHTFNAWWGCTKVPGSPACGHCYAEAWALRTGFDIWGDEKARRLFTEKHWREPLKWNKAAAEAGERRRVFCNSMSDVFEDRADLVRERERLFEIIAQTPQLDWLLLTKRPQNIVRLMPSASAFNLPVPWRNVWLGTTVEDQRHVERIDYLLAADARVRFLSCEPLMEPLDLSEWLGPRAIDRANAHAHRCGARTAPLDYGRGGRFDVIHCERCGYLLNPFIDWVIVGGESGGKARPFDLAWARSLRDQCKSADVAFFFKQTGAAPIDSDHRAGTHAPHDKRSIHRAKQLGRPADYLVNFNLILPKDRAGADIAEWPADLRVQEFPTRRAS